MRDRVHGRRCSVGRDLLHRRQVYAADAEAARNMLGSASKPVPMEAEIWGRHVDIVERRGDVWRTARRVVVFEVLQAQASAGLPLGSSWAQQSRATSDPLYDMRRRALEHGRRRPER